MSAAPSAPRTFLTTTEAGRELGVSREYAVRLADAGRLVVFGVAGSDAMRLFAREDVERYRREREAKRATKAARRAAREQKRSQRAVTEQRNYSPQAGLASSVAKLPARGRSVTA